MRAAARRYRLYLGAPGDLYLKRAKEDWVAFGTADAHRAALASLVNLPAK